MRYDELSDLTEQIEPTTFRLDDTTTNQKFVARQVRRAHVSGLAPSATGTSYGRRAKSHGTAC
jgi:hypothetical protein